MEGGYSIEAALPYVNTGIILAMAEMDYSKVIEPDISALRRPDPRCMTRVEQLIEQVGNIWRTRREVGRMLLDKCGGKWQRRKGIYYDEEGIREEQLETAHYCKNCSGYITVATNAAPVTATRALMWYAFCAIPVKTVKKRLMMTHCAPSKAVNINIFYCSTPIRALWKQFNGRLEFIK